MDIGKEDFDKLKELEESLWLTETRFDLKYMAEVLSPDFFEFGRSGRIYSIVETLSVKSQEINIKLPLKDFNIHLIEDNVVLVTYKSEILDKELLTSNRSSLWIKTKAGWKLRFHQGTPVVTNTQS